MSLVDNYQPPAFHPHRKALPPTARVQLPPHRTESPLARIDPNQTRSPTMMSTSSYQMPQNYSRPQNTNPVSYQAHMNQYHPTAKRTLSNATASTSSTGGRAETNSLQRSTSSRSGSSPNSYVALMRKQKATVWSDRAQQEDPRLLAAQKAAKMRAAMEVSNLNANRSATFGGRSKMRAHGVKAQQYVPGLHPAAGVPMRLSANEVDDGDDSEEERERQRTQTMSGRYHQRTESARSSLGSGSRMSSTYGTPTPPASSSQAPAPAQSLRSSSDDPAQGSPSSSFYSTPQRPAAPKERDSGNSDETDRENSFGGIGGLPLRYKPAEDDRDKATLDELRRRGSVDERSMTMSGYGRLFVANPDIDD